MTRLGRDSTKAADIPLSGTEVAIGYVNGSWPWSADDWSRFAHVPHLAIDVNGSHPEADCLDIEQGAATVGHAPGWTREHNQVRRDYPAILYCDRSTLTPLFNAMNADHLIVGRDFRLFIATLDGTRAVQDMTGVWGVQYAGEAMTGGHYDDTIVYDDAWKRPAPVTPPPPPPKPSPRALPVPPGLWLDAGVFGIGPDGHLWVSQYSAASGKWTTPTRL